jgi:drug/metabolite transporter (DMT)-like permease
VNHKLAVGLLVFANVLWGSSYVVAKIALEEVLPPLLGALRVLLASALLWPILIWRMRAGRLGTRQLIEPNLCSRGLARCWA